MLIAYQSMITSKLTHDPLATQAVLAATALIGTLHPAIRGDAELVVEAFEGETGPFLGYYFASMSKLCVFWLTDVELVGGYRSVVSNSHLSTSCFDVIIIYVFH